MMTVRMASDRTARAHLAQLQPQAALVLGGQHPRRAHDRQRQRREHGHVLAGAGAEEANMRRRQQLRAAGDHKAHLQAVTLCWLRLVLQQMHRALMRPVMHMGISVDAVCNQSNNPPYDELGACADPQPQGMLRAGAGSGWAQLQAVIKVKQAYHRGSAGDGLEPLHMVLRAASNAVSPAGKQER